MKADVEAADRRGRTSLHQAALLGHTLVVTGLRILDARAYLLPTGRYQQSTPLHFAAYSDRLEAVSLILSKGANLVLPAIADAGHCILPRRMDTTALFESC